MDNIQNNNLTVEIKSQMADILNEAGFELREPGCSACLAMNEDKIPAGKYAVSTSNRNFEGRQGPGARTILASPLTAARVAMATMVDMFPSNFFYFIINGILLEPL